jgi:hypothetical protein
MITPTAFVRVKRLAHKNDDKRVCRHPNSALISAPMRLIAVRIYGITLAIPKEAMNHAGVTCVGDFNPGTH